jgi:hypothetical protein
MKQLFSLMLLFSVAMVAKAQTADEAINKYITAMGGIDKLNSIKSLRMEGVSVMQNGNEINSTIHKVQGKLYRREINFGMGTIIMLVTEKGGWSTNPRSGGVFEPMNEEMLKNMKGEMECTIPLVNYAAKGHTAELVGKETINGSECSKIKLTLKTGTVINYFIDNQNGYLVRESRKGAPMGRRSGEQGGGEVEMITDYSDYKPVEGGYIFPMALAATGGFAGKTNFEKIEVNQPVDAKLYKAE